MKAGKITLKELAKHYYKKSTITLDNTFKKRVNASQQMVEQFVKQHRIAYGINTGVGKLASKILPSSKIFALQRNVVVSHAAGVGHCLAEPIVRIIMILKINSLIQGYSGVRWQVLEALKKIYNAGIIPCIPAKGSVGASGDLAPLAHLACALIGEHEVFYQGKRVAAKTALKKIGLKPLVLAPKEGLALVNGTQASNALLVSALIQCQTLFDAAMIAGTLSLEAARGSIQPLDPRIHAIRQMEGQSEVAALMRKLLKKKGRAATDFRVQDPYSLRCQPQVMGACLEQLRYAAHFAMTEVNSVTDNPIVIAKSKEIISEGNFHAQLLAFAGDAIANALATIGNIAERRIAFLMDPTMSGLPAFLIEESGQYSGLMVAHVTAAALASENKVLAHPASVDTIPTSNNQEDHVSMATFANQRLFEMLDNTANIVAIELFAACQALDFHQPIILSSHLKSMYKKIRQRVSFMKADRFLATDIQVIKEMVEQRQFVLSSVDAAKWCRLF